MPLDPSEFYAHALSAADAERRLPLSRMTYWDIFPFERDGLQVAPLQPPQLPEPERPNSDPATCTECAHRDEGVWRDEHWRLFCFAGVGTPLVLMLEPREHYDLAELPDERAGELGVLTVHVARQIEALPHIARAHVMRIGDGGAHLHVWFVARPEGHGQLRGSLLTLWDDLLPEYPAEVAGADAAIVARALAQSYGGQVFSGG
jgi:diadenosine tetraphosphate (Ap4A) HIT family hydrolase